MCSVESFVAPVKNNVFLIYQEHIEESAPFSFCGMDCFGPFVRKQGCKECKRHGLIFTCLSSLAVHIEMLNDLPTDSFINALRCFIGLRGAVSQLHCDQGTNFIGAKNEFQAGIKSCDVDTLSSFLAKKQFCFNAPSASHSGGSGKDKLEILEIC